MSEFKKLYFELFNELSDVIDELEKQNYGFAKEKIMRAQCRAEEAYISAEEDDEE